MTNEEINSMFQEVLEAINESSTKIEEKIDKKIEDLRQEMNQRFIESEKRIDQRFDWVEANMAAKSQMYRLIDVLGSKQTISEFDANYIMSNKPLN